ncbi:MAG TPA: aminotransferase class I/II-fold pyridoxal phosphate-dependent enzyme [Candidatus Limnocylindria bacterium]|nr:aminotransferase class I/II-fold pyridoxal phosphate-dependent enzyme [Candidatus Limnocylindria bacterium]
MGLLRAAIEPVRAWQETYGSVAAHPSLAVDPALVSSTLAELGVRLGNNYPFHHPRYAGQMLKPPHPVAVAAYTATMLINPNNHALDGGPATAAMEKEVVAGLAAMFGLGMHLGHLTSSGTTGNLEALFVARELHPDRGVAYSTEAHYTHARMCHVLGVEGYAVPTDATGRMDVDALSGRLRDGRVGTVVATLGTTGLGAVDPVEAIVPLARAHGVRVHVDAAYGGFFGLVADDSDAGVASAPFGAVRLADSVVVDPHKHGLQPYGCGAVLFADPSVGRFYAHDSPYTYFTSDELHLGEISLECSRAGAAAAALWATLQVLPLTTDGLGAVLRPGLRAARRWAGLLDASEVLETYQPPQLDIVSYLPRLPTLSQVDAASAAIMERAMTDADPVFLATFGVTGEALGRRRPAVRPDVDSGRILRSVLMKPEHEPWLDALHERVVGHARAVVTRS